MPRRTHPPVRAKHDRGHVRYHRDRKVKARARFYMARCPYWSFGGDWFRDRVEGPWGRLARENAWLGGSRDWDWDPEDCRTRRERLAREYESRARGLRARRGTPRRVPFGSVLLEAHMFGTPRKPSVDEGHGYPYAWNLIQASAG